MTSRAPFTRWLALAGFGLCGLVFLAGGVLWASELYHEGHITFRWLGGKDEI